MKIKVNWNKSIPAQEIHVSANDVDKKEVELIVNRILVPETITVVNPANNRSIVAEVQRIECVETHSNYSIIRFTGDNKEYIIRKRLKELESLNRCNIHRINNSVMVNLGKIKSFQVIENARLELQTGEGYKYIVSRFYAKKIKEELLCLKN